MSIKSNNRGDAVIRRSFDKKEEVRAGRILDKMNTDMERLERENENLKAELQKARDAYQRRCAQVESIKEVLEALQIQYKAEHERFMDCAQALTNSRKGHQKLTVVMKTALTPEQYHDARARAADLYPELFAKDEQS